jgi:protoporphyrinogen oxidase
MQQHRKWAIVGGGFLGMTLALRLAQQGRDVTLIEAAPELGGLASAWSLDGVVWDRHYHVTMLSDSCLRHILEEIGVADELRWVTTRTGFYDGTKIHPISNALEFIQFPVLRMIDKLRLALTIICASRRSDWKKLERIPVSDWLIAWSGRRTFERLWLPLLRAKLGDDYHKTSAAFIWATIARMYAARRTGLKKEMFGYVRGGYARTLARFESVLRDRGVEILLGQKVSRIRSTRDGTVVETPKVCRSFDEVVLTVPAPMVARLCPELRTEEQAAFQAIEYKGIVCASLLLRQSLGEYYITNIADPSVPFTAVIEMTAMVDRSELAGHALVYLPRYVASNDPLFEQSDESLREQFLAALERMYPHFHREDVLCFRFSRLRYVFPIPVLNYSETVPPIDTSVRGIHAVSSAQIVNGTLNVNETVRLAEQAAEHLISAARVRSQQQTLDANETYCDSVVRLG